ncbi:hypothetical protein [Planomonospora sp. ID82291]|uniref:hypothetical protein n=1 Tax=Planomonospora sp. ID82291 TaxID=2738136 RepID=UPI0018C3E71B|nr:hypothetical protein [Planomonospora sp. ID82291]MBG0818306.1 hypothetical protein [Planomonospora sp. ID82291]
MLSLNETVTNSRARRRLSADEIMMNGRVYRPTVYPVPGVISARANAVFAAAPGSPEREDALARFNRYYRVDRRTAFRLARSMHLRPRRYAQLEAERIAAQRIADCRAFGCCDV